MNRPCRFAVRWKTRDRHLARPGRKKERLASSPGEGTGSAVTASARFPASPKRRTVPSKVPVRRLGDAWDGRSPGWRVIAFRSAFPVVQTDQWRVVSVGSSRTVAGAATASAFSSLARGRTRRVPFSSHLGNRQIKCYSAKNLISSVVLTRSSWNVSAVHTFWKMESAATLEVGVSIFNIQEKFLCNRIAYQVTY